MVNMLRLADRFRVATVPALLPGLASLARVALLPSIPLRVRAQLGEHGSVHATAEGFELLVIEAGRLVDVNLGRWTRRKLRSILGLGEGHRLAFVLG